MTAPCRSDSSRVTNSPKLPTMTRPARLRETGSNGVFLTDETALATVVNKRVQLRTAFLGAMTVVRPVLRETLTIPPPFARPRRRGYFRATTAVASMTAATSLGCRTRPRSERLSGSSARFGLVIGLATPHRDSVRNTLPDIPAPAGLTLQDAPSVTVRGVDTAYIQADQVGACRTAPISAGDGPTSHCDATDQKPFARTCIEMYSGLTPR